MSENAASHPAIEIQHLVANQLRFRCRACGLHNHGEPVILLHGFPETSCMWTRSMTFLAARGYRCLAPDQRGYSAEARPNEVHAYAMDHLIADVIALADAVDFPRFHLIGHDWGATCAWMVAQHHPLRVQSLTAMSVPHPYALLQAKEHDSEQRKMSRYMNFFQLPLLPEWILGCCNYRLLRQQWTSFSAEERADSLDVLGTYRARRAALNWYRANKCQLSATGASIATPSLLIWGNQDPYIGRASIENHRLLMRGPYVFQEWQAGHYLVQDHYERVIEATQNHLQRYPLTAFGQEGAPVHSTSR